MAASSEYELEFPSTVPATDKLRDFIPGFFRLSDDAARNEEWVQCFCPEATLIMGDDEAQGTEKIRQLRGRMWDKVVSRKHTLYSFSEDTKSKPDEKGERHFMLTGQVKYGLKTGETKAARWTAHARVKEDADRVQFIFYKVEIHA